MPLIYNGQEAGNEKRLAFFEKDPIKWRDHPHQDLFKRLVALKKETPALWNAPWGARMVGVENDAPAAVFSFVRQNDKSRVFAAFNLSAAPRRVVFAAGAHMDARLDSWRDAFTDEAVSIGDGFSLDLEPWSWRVYVNE